MSNNSITSLNSTLTVIFTVKDNIILPSLPGFITDIIGVPYEVKEYDADMLFSVESQARNETRLGMSGQLLAGHIPHRDRLSLNLAPNSESAFIFQTLAGIEDVVKEAFNVSVTIECPAIGKTYSSQIGVITDLPTLPSQGRTMEAVSVSMELQALVVGVLG